MSASPSWPAAPARDCRAACECQILGHLRRPGRTHGSARRADPAARLFLLARGQPARSARAAAPGPRHDAADARCNGWCTRPAPTAAAGLHDESSIEHRTSDGAHSPLRIGVSPVAPAPAWPASDRTGGGDRSACELGACRCASVDAGQLPGRCSPSGSRVLALPRADSSCSRVASLTPTRRLGTGPSPSLKEVRGIGRQGYHAFSPQPWRNP